MISVSDYFGPFVTHKDATPARHMNASKLLTSVNSLMLIAESEGVVFRTNPKTRSQISGEKYGGFRPQDCPIGAPLSSHKTGEGADLYDPENEIDDWCMANLDKLEACGIYIEHPDATPGWSHWTTRAPKSGNRVFRP